MEFSYWLIIYLFQCYFEIIFFFLDKKEKVYKEHVAGIKGFI